LKDASASRVIAVLPYFCYARKDRKTKSRDPVTTRYIAQLLEAVGADRVVTLDVHNLAALQNAFRCPTDHLEAKNLLVEHFAPLVKNQAVVVVSPDVGGVKRAEQFRLALSQRLGREVDNAFLEKYRSAGKVSGQAVIGAISGKVAIIIDDIISTGGTLARAAQACGEQGAKHVYAAATHGVFAGKSDEILNNSILEELVVTNTVPPFRISSEAVRGKLHILDAAPLFALAIQRIHSGGPLTGLMEEE
jgi:ribose-phosphate pyrophosphokinase